ncbi:dUTP diphosphatase (plasmid) [Paenibacillus sp. EC2-1]|uniref:dUTP diphosphatase n=1 Tax=Paenibacillus sp. EC2-1 TaxID=3388665 RepID=UPI003BEEFF3E
MMRTDTQPLTRTYFFRPDVDKPAYKNNRPGVDAGYDLYSLEDKWLMPFQTHVLKTNSHIHIPKGLLGRVTSRSGHSKKGWLTHPGTIDHGYTGNIGVIMTNLSLFPRRIKAGTRIAQIIFMPFVAPEMEEVDDDHFYCLVERLSGSSRGETGFGDSGEH